MKVQELFDKLDAASENKEDDFINSGILNWSDKMKYGFFPLGLGVLTNGITLNSKAEEVEVKEGGIMVLGNDFGTVSYVEKYSGDLGETDSTTITNLLKKVNLNLDNTFFTNFYLGVRMEDGLYDSTTMTKRMYNGKVNKLKSEYKKLCSIFFITQLELLIPRLVICLGHDVKNALIDFDKAFDKWKPKSGSLEKLYSRNGDNFLIELNGTKFILIPHPCYAVNLKPLYVEKLNEILKGY